MTKELAEKVRTNFETKQRFEWYLSEIALFEKDKTNIVLSLSGMSIGLIEGQAERILAELRTHAEEKIKQLEQELAAI